MAVGLEQVREYMEAAIGKLSPAKAQELAKSLTKKGQGRDQVSKAAKDLLAWSNKNKERLTSMVQTEVKSQLKTIGVASRRGGCPAKARARAGARAGQEDHAQAVDGQAVHGQAPRRSGPRRSQPRLLRRAGLTPGAVARGDSTPSSCAAASSPPAARRRAPSAMGWSWSRAGRRASPPPWSTPPSRSSSWGSPDASRPAPARSWRPRSNGSRSTCMVATAWTRGRRPAASRTACSVEARRTWWRSTSATGSSPGRSEPTSASRSSIGPTCATCARGPAVRSRDRGRRPVLHLAPPRDPGARRVASATPTWSCWSSRSSRSVESGWVRAASSATRTPGATRSASRTLHEHGLSPIAVMASPLPGPPATSSSRCTRRWARPRRRPRRGGRTRGGPRDRGVPRDVLGDGSAG